jgi:hypothetical protein
LSIAADERSIVQFLGTHRRASAKRTGAQLAGEHFSLSAGTHFELGGNVTEYRIDAVRPDR